MNLDARSLLDSFRTEVDLAVVTILSALLTGYVFLTTRKRLLGTSEFRNVGADHRFYYQLGQDASECTNPAFCRRILKPFLADALPVDLQSGFLIVTFLSLATVGVMVYACCRAYGFSFQTAVVGMFLYFQLRSVVPYSVMNFWMVDSLAFVLLCTGFYGILTDSDGLFLISLVLGILTKETLLMLLPLYYGFRATELFDRSVVRRIGLYAVLTIAVLVGLNVLISVEGGASLLSKLDLTYHLTDDPERFITQFTLLPFGLMLVLPLWALERNVDPFVKSLPFLAAVFGQLLLATDASRLITWAFPVLILLSLNGIERLAEILDGIGSSISIQSMAFIPVLIGLVLTNWIIEYPWWFNNGVDISLFVIYTVILYLVVILSRYWPGSSR